MGPDFPRRRSADDQDQGHGPPQIIDTAIIGLN